jgi:hypothetical protein
VREFRKKTSLTTPFNLKTIKNSSTAAATSSAISVLIGKKFATALTFVNVCLENVKDTNYPQQGYNVQY